MINTDGVNTLSELVEEVANANTGGYDIGFNVLPHKKSHRHGDGFFLVIDVSSNEPNSILTGEWWFDADHNVMQVRL